MATYKAEFLAHYYEGRPRPVWAYAFGLIMYWAHVASRAPRVVNALAHAPGVSALAKAAARMAPQRRIPPFSQRTFRDWYAEHRASRPNAGAKRVLLWADTFNDHFHSETARHALEVLEAAGFDAVVPAERLCCGRPLYDYGMLDLAKTFLRQIIDALRDDIEAGTPIVVLEPSCASVFRDELPNLLPQDQDARRLSGQVVTLAELLDRDGWTPPRLERAARVHPHCHHHSVLGTGADHRVLERMGVRAQWLDDGCCGMAGAFGFEAGEHYDVSIACGELGYLPHVRETGERDLIVSDGFSCREQAAQTTDRQVLHLADVIWLALRYGRQGPDGAYPERAAMPLVADQVERARSDAFAAALAFASIVAGIAAGAAAAWRTRTR
jgi:Fe-S oxidoreductase